MKKIRIFLSIILIFSIVTYASIQLTNDKSIAQAGTLSINSTSYTLELGHYKNLRIYGTTKTPYWYSSNSKVATVSSSGKVTAYASGTTTITASVSGKKLTCKITVFQISKKTLSLAPGKSTTLTVWGPYKKITWTSSDESIATVSSKGTITAKAIGNATITANVDGKELACKVSIIGMSKSSMVLELGGTSGYVADLSVINTTDKITWSSDNKAIATVSSKGTVTAKGIGTATITATVNGAKVTCKVKVLKISTKAFTLKLSQVKTLKISGTTSKITWTSNHRSVATVSSNGTVTPVSVGTARITGLVDGRNMVSIVTVTE